MSFHRSTAGLTNQHLFYNVDYIVFVEGGPHSYALAQVMTGEFNETSIDILFWSKLFMLYKPETKYKFKAVGSKTTCVALASAIEAGTVNNSLVAMDSEFDELFGIKINHPKIFYTRGYSWENDAWSFPTVKQIIEDLTATTLIDEQVEKTFNLFIKKMKIGVYADAYLFKKGDAFFPRRGYLRCVSLPVTNQHFPIPNDAEINQILAQKGLTRPRLYAFARKKQLTTHRYCFGHLLSDFCFQVIQGFLRFRVNLQSLPRETILRLTLTKFIGMIEHLTEVKQYYDIQFARE